MTERKVLVAVVGLALAPMVALAWHVGWQLPVLIFTAFALSRGLLLLIVCLLGRLNAPVEPWENERGGV